MKDMACKTTFSRTVNPRRDLLSTRLHQVVFKGIILLLVLTFQLHASCAFHLEWGPDLEGPWCAKREVGEDCCTGRDDYCSVPILGTVCYCDIFCNATAYDCCPDYFPHCFGLNIRSTTPRPTTLPPPRPVGELFVDNVALL